MAKKYENEQGFLIIEMSPIEAQMIGFGLSEGCVCMGCNDIIEDTMYYVAALNDVVCKDCLDDWLSYATRYDEDIKYEERHFNHYMNLLK